MNRLRERAVFSGCGEIEPGLRDEVCTAQQVVHEAGTRESGVLTVFAFLTRPSQWLSNLQRLRSPGCLRVSPLLLRCSPLRRRTMD